MNKRIQDIVDTLEGKIRKKKKKYVDDEEYSKMKKPMEESEDTENTSVSDMKGKSENNGESDEKYSKSDMEEKMSNGDKDKKRKGRLFGRGLSIVIAMGKKK